MYTLSILCADNYRLHASCRSFDATTGYADVSLLIDGLPVAKRLQWSWLTHPDTHSRRLEVGEIVSVRLCGDCHHWHIIGIVSEVDIDARILRPNTTLRLTINIPFTRIT